MKVKILFFALYFLSSSCCFCQDKVIRLIVRADDMGFSHSGNVAIVKVCKEGIAALI